MTIQRSGTEAREVAGDSAALAIGTAVSRATGLGRMLVIPAVFGATAIGDMFLAVNALPQTLFATFGGQALSSMLVPVIVRALERDPRRADLLGRTALSLVAAALAGLVALGMIFHRAIAAALASGIEGATSDGAAAIAAVLLLVMLPQIVLYGIVSVLVALQHARGKFLLPSAAPTVENVVLVAAVLVIAGVVGDIHLTTSDDTRVLVALGMGSTLALMLHVIVQAIGAIRAGAPVVPGRLRREPELQALRGQVRSSLAWTLMYGPRIIGVLIAAGWAGVGAIQAFQIGYLVQNLPMALIGYPIAAALLPRLSRRAEGSSSIASGYSEARNLALWVLVPMGAGTAFLSEPLSEVLALGRFSSGDGPTLLAAAIVGLALAGVSEATYEIARQATLAYGDITGFTRSIWLRGIISLAGIPLMPVFFDGATLLFMLGLVVSISDLAALIVIDAPLRRIVDSTRSFLSTAARTIGAATLAGVLALVVARALEGAPSLVALVSGGTVFLGCYLLLAWLVSGRSAPFGGVFDGGFRSLGS